MKALFTKLAKNKRNKELYIAARELRNSEFKNESIEFVFEQILGQRLRVL